MKQKPDLGAIPCKPILQLAVLHASRIKMQDAKCVMQ